MEWRWLLAVIVGVGLLRLLSKAFISSQWIQSNEQTIIVVFWSLVALAVVVALIKNLRKTRPTTERAVNRKYLDVLFFVAGPVLFVLGFFGGFRLDPENQIELVAIRQGRSFCPSALEVTLMALGIGTICLGFLMRSWRRSGFKKTDSDSEEKAKDRKTRLG
jgi:uncharacterized membrane protein